MKASVFSVVSVLVSAASARLRLPLPPKVPFTPEEALLPVQQATFQQLLNHSNPAQGTFSQRYYWDSEFWNGPGSPVSICPSRKRICL